MEVAQYAHWLMKLGSNRAPKLKSLPNLSTEILYEGSAHHLQGERRLMHAMRTTTVRSVDVAEKRVLLVFEITLQSEVKY